MAHYEQTESVICKDGQLFIKAVDFIRAKELANNWCDKTWHRAEYRYTDGFIPNATFVFKIR